MPDDNNSIAVVEKLEGLVNIRGPLLSAIKELEPGSMQSSSEIIRSLIADNSVSVRFLRTTHCLVPIDDGIHNKNFVTSDGAMYATECGEPVLYITDYSTNPIFRKKEQADGSSNHLLRNLDDAIAQLLHNGNYALVKSYDVIDVLASRAAARISLSNLRLKGDDKETKHLEIDTAECMIIGPDGNKYSLNKDESVLAYRAFGAEGTFEHNMAAINKKGMRTAKIPVLNPDYVKEKAPNGGAIVRACSLQIAPNEISFSAAVRFLNNTGNYIRGIALS